MAKQKRDFLASEEFYDLLAWCSRKMLMHGFNDIIRQFIQVKLVIRGTDLSFLDTKKVWEDLLDSEKGDAPPEAEEPDDPAETELLDVLVEVEQAEALEKAEESHASEQPATLRDPMETIERND